jgi:hypothetical protein
MKARTVRFQSEPILIDATLTPSGQVLMAIMLTGLSFYIIANSEILNIPGVSAVGLITATIPLYTLCFYAVWGTVRALARRVGAAALAFVALGNGGALARYLARWPHAGWFWTWIAFFALLGLTIVLCRPHRRFDVQ